MDAVHLTVDVEMNILDPAHIWKNEKGESIS